jgi:hypothetical protein
MNKIITSKQNPYTDPIPSDRYIFIGEMLNALQVARTEHPTYAVGYFGHLVHALDCLDLPYPKQNFDRMRKRMDEFMESVLDDQKKLTIWSQIVVDLRSLIGTAHEQIVGAAAARLTIALNTGDVSDRLAKLPEQLARFNKVQSGLLYETQRCLETGTYRAATVMGWNMAFDYIRQWIFDNHLTDFNTVLTANYTNRKTGNPVYERIGDYSDFLKSDAPGERVILDTCNSGGKIVGNCYEDLKGYLRQRNTYAHPSEKQPTPTQVNALLEHLVDLISGAPFN